MLYADWREERRKQAWKLKQQGVEPRLRLEQKAQIPDLLTKGAEAYGFRGDVWTAKRVAKVIENTFGVKYSRDHVGKLLRQAGWSRRRWQKHSKM